MRKSTLEEPIARRHSRRLTRRGSLRGAFGRISFVALAVSTTLFGCASRSTEVRAVPFDTAGLAQQSCTQLRDQLDRVDADAFDAAAQVDKRFADNAALILISGLVWPAALAIRADGEQARRLGELKGRHDALTTAIEARDCPAPPAISTPALAAELAVSPGDRYVYQSSKVPGAEVALQVSRIGAARIEMDGGRWPQDLAGNRLPDGSVFEASTPPADAPDARTPLPYVVGLLKPGLRLGQSLSGVLTIGADAPALEVTAEVVGLGPAQLSPGSVPTATLEWVGRIIEPGAGNGTARATIRGVLVVDSRNGMLVRLQSQAAAGLPALDVRLLRVERRTDAGGMKPSQ